LGSLTKSQTFSPDWPEQGPIKAEWGPNEEKIGFSRYGSSITYFQSTNNTNELISSLNWVV